MKRIVIGFLAFFVYLPLSTATHSINYKRLDSDVDICINYLWRGYPIKREQIEDRLKFVQDIDLNNKDYADPNRFKILYKSILADQENTNERLRNFVSGCRVIYEESEHLATKIAIPFLLEGVTKKYTTLLKQLKRKKELEWQMEFNDLRYDNPHNILDDPIFKAVFNTDTNTTRHYFPNSKS